LTLVPLIIFVAEMVVVTLTTLRIIFTARGHKFLAPLMGFFEVLTWVFAIGQVLKNLDNWTCSIAFALGFAMGNYLGLLIDKKLALGTALVRVITHRPAQGLIQSLRAAQFGVTCILGQGAKGPVQILMTVVKRRQLDDVFAMIEAHHPDAFYSVAELQSASDGVFPEQEPTVTLLPSALNFLRQFRARLGQMPVKNGDGYR
jgi:uncharacterized protein YebE (UPF0316 family)